MYLRKLKDGFIKSNTRKRLLENFFSLSLLQIANYILPLITLPYLVRVLGPEKYGLIAFSQAFIGYFIVITDYGFNLSATREISINRENKEKISEIFSSVMIIKVSLLIISLFLMSIIIFSFDKFRNDWFVYYLTFGMVVGQVLFPVWFFQGIEKMKYITFLNILAKVIFTVAIFVIVKESSDYLYVPLLNSFGFIIAGILGLWIVFKDFDINFKFVGLEEIKRQLKTGWYLFITSVQSNILSSSGIFVLGLFENKTVVGYYSAVEKLLKAFVYIFSPVTQSIYPYSSSKLAKDIYEGKKFIVKIGALTTFISILVACNLIYFSDDLLKIVYGEGFIKYSIIIKVLSIWLILAVMNNFLGIQYLSGLGKFSLYMKSFSFSTIVTLVLYFIFTPLISYYGILLGMLFGEFTLTLTMIYYIRRFAL